MAAVNITEVIKNIQGKWLELPEIKAAPNHAPEALTAFPFAVTYERSGVLQLRSYGWAQILPNILYSELHIGRTLLPQAIELAQSMRDVFLKKFISDPQLGNLVDTAQNINFEFGRLEWAGVQTLGYRFIIPTKSSLTL